MNPAPLHSEVEALHACYCEAVNFKMPLTFSTIEGWERYIHAGFTVADLRTVLRYWRGQIERGMNVGVLRFSRLIRDHEKFSEDLCLAHAASRKPVPTPREKALRELRPQACEPPPPAVVKHGKELAMRALEEMRRSIAN